MSINTASKVSLTVLTFAFASAIQIKSEDLKVGPHKIHKSVEHATKHLESSLEKHPEKHSLSFEVKKLCEIIDEIKKHNYRKGFPVGKEFRTKVETLSPDAKKILTHIERQAHELTPNKNCKTPFGEEAVDYFEKIENILKEGKTIPKVEKLMEGLAAKPERPEWMERLEKESREDEASTITGKVQIAVKEAYDWVKKQTVSLWETVSGKVK